MAEITQEQIYTIKCSNNEYSLILYILNHFNDEQGNSFDEKKELEKLIKSFYDEILRKKI
jgi:hypothetical protein